MVKNITDHEWYMNYENEVLNCNKPAVLVFGASWCSSCKSLLATLEMMDFDVEVLHLDVDECDTLADELNITGLPTVVVYEHCEVTNVFENNTPSTDIVGYISGMVEV